MSRSIIMAALAAVLIFSSFAVSSHAEALSCQTINGQTICLRGSGSLSCQTINGNTTCVGSNGLRCDTVKGRLTCRGGNCSSVQTPAPTPPIEIPPSADDEDDPGEMVA